MYVNFVVTGCSILFLDTDLQASFAKKPKPKLQCPDFNIKPPPALTEVQGICKCTWAFNVSENKMFVINIIQKGPGMPKAKGKAQPEASLILPDGIFIFFY